MKKTVVFAAGVLALGAVAYLGSRLMAQTAGQTVPAAAAAKSTRIAILNLAYVIKYYHKCLNFQNEMKGTIKSFEDRINQKKKLAEDYTKELQTNPATARKDELEKNLKNLQREAEDINNDAKLFLSKKNDEQMVIVYKEIQDAVMRYSQSQSIDLVLHYTDAPDAKDSYTPPVIDRKMRSPGAMPMFYSQGVDISYDVVMALNAQYGRTTPTNGTPAK